MKLVITADDLGIAPGVTRAILEAHRAGIVRSASALVTYPGSADAVAAALAEPDLEVGVHLDLVGGWPVSHAADVRSLVDAEGRFHALPAFTRRLLTGRIRSTDVARELRAQVELARSWGAQPLAWDSHRHTHLMPPVARVVGSLARELGVRWVRRGRAPRARLASRALGLHASSLVCELVYRDMPGNTWFVDLTATHPRLDPTAIALLPMFGGVGEISTHPGYVDDDLGRLDDLLHERERDLALLTTPLLRRAIGRDTLSWRVS